MNIEEIFKQCPKLHDIATRLADSEKQIESENEKHSGKTKKIVKLVEGNYVTQEKRSYGIKYPDHFQITAVHCNGAWDTIAHFPSFGKDNFQTSIFDIVSRYKPIGLKINVYNGKRVTSRADNYMCWIVADASSNPEIKRENELARNAENGLGEKITELAGLIKANKELAPPPTFSVELLNLQFEQRFNDLKHEQELNTLKTTHARELEKLNGTIEDRDAEIEELQAELAHQDDELGTAADMIELKQKPPAMQTIFAAALETAAVKLCMNNPKLLGAFGLTDEQVKEIFAEQNKQITGGDSAGNAASFTDYKEVTKYENQTTDAHIEAAKNICLFINNLSLADFKTLYTIIFYCSNETGDFIVDNANSLIALIHAEKTASANQTTTAS